MFNGTNLTLNSDLALVSTQVKTLLYIVGQKARESSDTSMWGAYTRALENQQNVSHTFTHRGIKYMCGSRGGTGGPDLPSKITKI